MRIDSVRRFLITLAATAAIAAARLAPGADTQSVTIGVQAEDFQFHGSWAAQGARGEQVLFSGGDRGGGRFYPAATAVDVPVAGRYRLWVRAVDFPSDRPGIRTAQASVAGKASPEKFGDHGKDTWVWESGGEFDLPAGPTMITLRDATPFTRTDAVLLTNDLSFTPTTRLGTDKLRATQPIKLPTPTAADPMPPRQLIDADGASPAATLQNDRLRITFTPASLGGKPTFRPRVSVRNGDAWNYLAISPADETYAVVAIPEKTRFEYVGYYPRWTGATSPAITVEAGGVSVETLIDGGAAVPWLAGQCTRFVPREVKSSGDDTVTMTFHPEPIGELVATWQLKPGERSPRLKLTFTPKDAGEYSIGYHAFAHASREKNEVDEVLMPFMFQRLRMGSRPRTMLDPFMPSPVSLFQTTAAGGRQPSVFGVAADPSMIPFRWPTMEQPNVALSLQTMRGDVQPAIYAPVPGKAAAKRQAGQPVELSLRVIAEQGDWYAGYRTTADEVYGLRDYRENVGTSLSEAALNMIDLIMDDKAGGWWDRAKAFYQIESKNGSTHASPQLLLSLYRLTGDEAIYRKRALPTIEFMLSRGGAHFSPIPNDTGIYPAGDMNGPVKMFGTTTYAGLWELSGRRTPALRDIALPSGDGVKVTTGYTHGQQFEELLVRYKLTGDATLLARAKEQADRYVASHITKASTEEMGPEPFFFIQFVPTWEGMLLLHESTGEQKYLDAAAFGARQLMTGVWTQPLFPPETTIHPGGEFKADTLEIWRGPEKYRLGTPRKKGDVTEKQIPGWIVSNVGISFEQPSTYKGSNGPGRMILQVGFAPNFLRLAQLTKDKAFETYARNAVIGRFANYPGYYMTGFTDLPLNPRYPYDGPDVTNFYYHHIAPHLAWTIDYLVAEATMKSDGKISFPSQRQYGYAYFDAQVYGHAAGKVYGEENAWLWLRRGLVNVDNAQVNTLTAHNGRKFFAILTNQSHTEQSAVARFNAEALKFDPTKTTQVQVILPDGGLGEAIALRDGQSATVTLPPRGMVTLALDGVQVSVPTHQPADAVDPNAPAAEPSIVVTKVDGAPFEIRATTIRMDPASPADGYVWATADLQQAKSLTLQIAPTNGGASPVWKSIGDNDYPFEFSFPITAGAQGVRYRVSGVAGDGKAFSTPEQTLNAAPSKR